VISARSTARASKIEAFAAELLARPLTLLMRDYEGARRKLTDMRW
jgi:hypothetical protein